MTDYTANIKLVLPAFDQTPWDGDLNNDLIILDALYGKFFGAPNMAGVWQNATLYNIGQVVVDQDDGSMWTCATANTSAAAPTTFSADRSNNPSFWVNAASGGQAYVTQAQNFANSALTSANNAANSATAAAGSASVVAGALPLSGGTMTGNLTLHNDPTTALMAATKQYVDARVGGTGFLPLTGGTLTGTLNGTTINANSAGGFALTGVTGSSWAANASVVNFTFASNGRLQLDRTTGNLSYGPTTGGSVFTIGNTGNVTSAISFQTPTFTVSSSLAQFYSDANYTYIRMDTSGWRFQYDRANGHQYWINGSGIQYWAFRNDGFCEAFINAVGGNGAYVNLSDERIKHDIAEIPYGMETIGQLHPVEFIRDGRQRIELGFTAQDVMRVLPEAVTTVHDDLLAVSGEAILAVAVNAIQQLDQRLSRLEAR